jgi:hypothetical protein
MVTLNQPAVSMFSFGISAFSLATAINPIALTTPKDGFNWAVIPRRAKVLQAMALILIILAMTLKQ